MTRAEARIDLDAFAHNLEVLRSKAPGSQQMAIVKADAYGHGLLPMARAARDAGAEWLGVALFAEALELRAAGDTGALLAWLASPDDPWAEVLDAGVDVGVSSPAQLDRIAATGRRARLHLKLDTGLGRAGCPPAQWGPLLEQAKAMQAGGAAEIVALWSHFTVADDPRNPLNTVQIERFRAGVEQAAALGVEPEHLHLANSAATLSLPDAHFTMVRPGIAMYGVSPGAQMGTPAELGLRPVMTLVGTVDDGQAPARRVRVVVRPPVHAAHGCDHRCRPAGLRRRHPPQRDQCRPGVRVRAAADDRGPGLHGPVRGRPRRRSGGGRR